jgi:hypothetical protein
MGALLPLGLLRSKVYAAIASIFQFARFSGASDGSAS